MKLSVLIDYFKSCTVLFSVFFMIFYILTNVAQSAVSIYLSDWSNNADNPDDNKYVRLGVYTALGLAQCNTNYKLHIHYLFILTNFIFGLSRYIVAIWRLVSLEDAHEIGSISSQLYALLDSKKQHAVSRIISS